MPHVSNVIKVQINNKYSFFSGILAPYSEILGILIRGSKSLLFLLISEVKNENLRLSKYKKS